MIKEVKKKSYPFDEIENKWQKKWLNEKTFKAYNPNENNFDKNKEKLYILDMFPYPSGEGLHVGHPEGYTASDIYTRYKRRKGFNVLHPMGWDAFGLPAEQYAIKTGNHPREITNKNIDNFRRQLKNIGFAYDWDREVNTTDPNYYKWTQWIFLKLYNSYFCDNENKAKSIDELEKQGLSKSEIDEKRLAYVANAPVNWCEELGTVLANEEVIDGKSERGGYKIEKKMMRQWMLRITKYSQRLIDELEDLDWNEGVKLLQKNWIGKSEGAEVLFNIEGYDENLKVYTTRPDTLYGVTYMALAPEHEFVNKITTQEQKEEVENYCKNSDRKSELERSELGEKTGVWTGAFAVNPLNNQKIPIYVADYVLISYGSGAIMAVPAHDERDYQFAKKYDIEIKRVVKSKNDKDDKLPYSKEGIAVNSKEIENLPTGLAKAKMIEFLEDNKLGNRSVNYKLRDWLFSRQRYWGEPFPIIWDENGNHFAVDVDELPVQSPGMKDFKPTGTTKPPLSKAKDWVKYSDKFNRETNTMPQWAGSCWYYIRFCDTNNSNNFIDKEVEKYWSGEENGKNGMVDLYIGGTEHAVLHLLYARFWHKVLYDLGYLSKSEPFQKLVNQGMILGEDNVKMSKSRGNVISPDSVIEDFGADSLRLYEMFMGPLEQVKPWSTKGVQGVHRFLSRVWRLCIEESIDGEHQISKKICDCKINAKLNKLVHFSIKKVSEDIENLNFNTAISQLMILSNELINTKEVPLQAVATLLQLLEPFAPHLSEEIYEKLSLKFNKLDKKTLTEQNFPVYNKQYLEEQELTIIVQVNGKVRDKVTAKKDISDEDLKSVALNCNNVKKYVNDKKYKKIIVVKGRLVNIVI